MRRCSVRGQGARCRCLARADPRTSDSDGPARHPSHGGRCATHDLLPHGAQPGLLVGREPGRNLGQHFGVQLKTCCAAGAAPQRRRQLCQHARQAVGRCGWLVQHDAAGRCCCCWLRARLLGAAAVGSGAASCWGRTKWVPDAGGWPPVQACPVMLLVHRDTGHAGIGGQGRGHGGAACGAACCDAGLEEGAGIACGDRVHALARQPVRSVGRPAALGHGGACRCRPRLLAGRRARTPGA